MKSVKVKHPKMKLALLECLSIAASALPLLIVLCCKWGEYTRTPSDKVRLGAGAIIVLVLLALKVLNKLKMPSATISLGVCMVLAYLLETVLNDLAFLLFIAFVGSLIDLLFFQTSIRALREKITIGKTAEASAEVTTEKIREVLDEYIGRA